MRDMDHAIASVGLLCARPNDDGHVALGIVARVAHEPRRPASVAQEALLVETAVEVGVVVGEALEPGCRRSDRRLEGGRILEQLARVVGPHERGEVLGGGHGAAGRIRLRVVPAARVHRERRHEVARRQTELRGRDTRHQDGVVEAEGLEDALLYRLLPRLAGDLFDDHPEHVEADVRVCPTVRSLVAGHPRRLAFVILERCRLGDEALGRVGLTQCARSGIVPSLAERGGVVPGGEIRQAGRVREQMVDGGVLGARE